MKLLAFDYGASSGRAIVGTFDGKKIELNEIHRFLNEPVQVNGVLYWDILRLYQELKNGLLKANSYDVDCMGIDTWGVDFAFLGKDGNMLANPYHYRAKHTENAIEEICKVLKREEIFAKTGLAFQPFNTLCQLYTMKNDGNPSYDVAKDALFIPDLFNYFLTGNKVCEFTIASTSQLIKPGKNEWCDDIFNAYGIKNLFPEIVSAGTKIGSLRQGVMDELQLSKSIPVIATAEHDTGSAYVAVPAETENCAFLSSGTWSLLGCESDTPILTKEALDAGYTNEGGVGNNIRFLKNIMGLWIIQECKRQWDKEGEVLSFQQIADGAAQVEPCKFIINPDYKDFYSPFDMPNKIVKYCKETGGAVPTTKFEIARCVYDSLALTYKHNLIKQEQILGKKIDVLHIVGGGANNVLLNIATADATGIKVTAGPTEGTALGNILTQLIAMGEIKDLKEARQIVRNSTNIKEYLPKNTGAYEKGYERFLKLL